MAPRAASRPGHASGGQRQDTRSKQEAPQKPLPPPWPIDETQCLILTRDIVDADFTAGTPVVITAQIPMPQSPTQYPGQTAVPLNVNSFLYRFKRYKANTTFEQISSDPLSTRITGNQLSRLPRGRGNVEERYRRGDLVYVVDAVPDVRSRILNKIIKIPIGYRARVLESTSSAGPNAQLASANRFSRPWILEYAVKIVTRDWVMCGSSAPGDAFRLPTPRELADWRRELAAPRIEGHLVNVDEAHD